MANPEHLEIVSKGSKSINEWRKQHQHEYFDLSEADLHGRDLAGANLSEANLSEANFSNADLSDANLLECHLSKVNLSGAKLSAAYLSMANLFEANLSNANLAKANLYNVNLSKSDLSNAVLSGAELLSADLFKANVSNASFQEARLPLANLVAANLFKTDFSKADLTLANLYGADLREAILSKADLFGSNFSNTNLSGVVFTNAICEHTNFVNCNLSDCQGLESVIHQGPSSIGIDTLMRSIGTIPKAFLRGAGVPDTIIDFFSSLAEEPRYYTCFISFGSPDAEFVNRLHKDLTDKGVRCWKYDKEAVIGRDVWANIDRAIEDYDKVIVVCSEDSLNRKAVLDEIERSLQKEEKLRQENAKRAKEAKSKGQKPKLLDEDVLCPVRLDNYVFDEWKHPRKADVTKKHIGDFQEWKTNKKRYSIELNKLLHALDPKSWGPVKET